MTSKRITRRILLGAILPVLLICTWHVVASRSVVVPSIGSVLRVLCSCTETPQSLDTTSLAYGAAISVLRVACGFAIAVVTGVALGICLGLWSAARDILSPTLSVAMAISPIAWLPISIIVFGLSSPATVAFGDDAWRYGMLDGLRLAVVAVIWYASFIPIAVNTAAGVRAVRHSHIESARVMGASRRQVLTKVILPSALPSIVTGLRIGGGMAWRVIIAAEIFPGTQSGLGYMIAASHEIGEYEYAFAAIIVIGAIGLALDGGLRLLALQVGRWQPREK